MDTDMNSMENIAGASSEIPLSDNGVDLSNQTQAMDFLEDILDDADFQIDGNAFARYFWYGIVVVIGIAAICNVIQKTTLQQRIRAAAAKSASPARATSLVGKLICTVTAVVREVTYVQITPARQAFWVKVPPFGVLILLLAYLGFVLALEYINNDVPGAQHYTALSVRAGWLAVAQVPLLILLAGKNNLVGLVTGASYERLNVLHRWVARMLLLLATLHFGYQSYGWNQYGLMQLEWSTDDCPPTGIATYAILLWMNLSTLAPLRNLSYEFFVVQHFLTFFGFIIAVMYHLPSTALYSRVYIWIPIGLYLFDRLVRSLRYVYNNAHPGKASLTAMEGGTTRIRVSVKNIGKWKAGAHVLLSIPRLGLAQSHPATIASIPSFENSDLVFILKGHNGFTKNLLKSAKSSSLPRTKQEAKSPAFSRYMALIDGPYGGSQADFAAFDTVLLFAGSTGVAFTIALLQDIAHRSSIHPLPVHRVEFIWVVKNATWTSWVAEELSSSFFKLHAVGIEVEIKVFVTCDDPFTHESEGKENSGCQCDKSLGPCCCIRPAEKPGNEEVSRSTSDASAEQVDEKSEGADSRTDITAAPAYTVTQSAPCCANRTTADPLHGIVAFKPGRPPVYDLIWEALDKAQGETGVATCGPLGLNAAVRTTVAKISDERAMHKGGSGQGMYMHAEGFCW